VILDTSVMKSAAYSIIYVHRAIFLKTQQIINKYKADAIIRHILAAKNVECESDYGSICFSFIDLL